jgi:hypothetical protein
MKGSPKPEELDDLMAEALTDEDTGRAPSRQLRRRAEFIRGPFDQVTFCLVAKLGRGPLVIWIQVHHLIRLKHRPDIHLPARLLAVCGMSRRHVYRAVKLLERHGLISVSRAKGRALRISPVELGDEAESTV